MLVKLGSTCLSPLVSRPSICAASRCLSGFEAPVKLNTAGAVMHCNHIVRIFNKCSSISYHAQPVWNDWMLGRVASRLVTFHIACYGVGESMAEVHPGVSKTDPCKGGRQVHLAPGEGQIDELCHS